MQDCAKEGLGKQDITFPSFYQQPASFAEPMPTGAAFSPARDLFGANAKKRRWDMRNTKDQYAIDAFTVDPCVVCKRFRGIRFGNMPRAVSQNAALNASVGQMPTMLVYITTHPKFGTKIFYPYLGAKGGTQKRNTWQDYQYWGHNITREELAHLRRCAYYNQPQARAKARELMAAAGADASSLDRKLFRVRL